VPGNGGIVCHAGPIVEAFPNAFLGVLMPEADLLSHRGSSEDGDLTGFTIRITGTSTLIALLGDDRKAGVGAVRELGSP
jgi:hypothetical protein